MGILKGLAIVSALLLWSCDNVEFNPGVEASAVDDSYGIRQGVAIDPDLFVECNPDNPLSLGGACMVFFDSFERDVVVEHEDFRWDVAVMDNGYNGSNIDAKIEDYNHLGPIYDEDRSLLFRGRDGGSTHEIYVVSNGFDFSQYDEVYIEYHYVGLGLEDKIKLTHSGQEVPEGVRVEVCRGTDFDCGLSGDDRHLRLRDNSQWDPYYPEPMAKGSDLNIRSYQQSDWNLGQVFINLNKYDTRKNNFVFRFTVALDEGYLYNDRNQTMEDGLILDSVALVAVKRAPRF